MSGFGKSALHGLQCPRLEQALDRLSAVLCELCARLEATHDFPHSRHLELHVSDEEEVNARAFLIDEPPAYVVEFTLGMVVWLDAVSATIAIHSSRDFESGPSPQLFLGSSNEKHPAFQERLDQVSSLLPEGDLGAWESLLQKFAVAIFAHETSHITRGHLDLLAAKLDSQGKVDELAARRATARSSDLIRLLEFDADTFSARVITHLALHPPEFLARWNVNAARETLVETLLGIILFYVALEREESSEGTRSPYYPRPLLRLLIILIEMDRLWTGRHAEEDFFEHLFTGALSVLKLFESTYSEIGLLRSLLDQDFLEETIGEAGEIIDTLQQFEHTIISYAFDGEGLWPHGFYE